MPQTRKKSKTPAVIDPAPTLAEISPQQLTDAAEGLLPEIRPLPGEMEAHTHARKHYFRLRGQRSIGAALDEHQRNCILPRYEKGGDRYGSRPRKRDREDMSVRWHNWARDYEWLRGASLYDEECVAVQRESQERLLLNEYERKARLGELGLTIMENQLHRMLASGDTIPKSDLPRRGSFLFQLRQEGLLQGKEEDAVTEQWKPDEEYLRGVELKLGPIIQTIVNINGEPLEPEVDDEAILEGYLSRYIDDQPAAGLPPYEEAEAELLRNAEELGWSQRRLDRRMKALRKQYQLTPSALSAPDS